MLARISRLPLPPLSSPDGQMVATPRFLQSAVSRRDGVRRILRRGYSGTGEGEANVLEQGQTRSHLTKGQKHKASAHQVRPQREQGRVDRASLELDCKRSRKKGGEGS